MPSCGVSNSSRSRIDCESQIPTGDHNLTGAVGGVVGIRADSNARCKASVHAWSEGLSASIRELGDAGDDVLEIVSVPCDGICRSSPKAFTGRVSLGGCTHALVVSEVVLDAMCMIRVCI